MHLVKLIERRFPNHKRGLTGVLFLVSASLLLVGIGLIFAR